MEQIKKGDKLYYNNIKTRETIVEVIDISKESYATMVALNPDEPKNT